MTVETQPAMGAAISKAGHALVAIARHYPILIASSSLLLFILFLYGNSFFGQPEPVRALIDVIRIDLDRQADGPTALVRTPALSIDTEREAMLSTPFIDEILGRIAGKTQGSLRPARALSSDGLPSTAAVQQHLRIAATSNETVLELSLDADDIGVAYSTTEIVNKIADAYVGLRNREREQQKQGMLTWANERMTSMRETIQQLKDKAAAPSLGVASSDGRETAGNRLIHFFITATRVAQEEMLSGIHHANAARLSRDQQRLTRIDTLHDHLAGFSHDLARLEMISQAYEKSASRQQEAILSKLDDAEQAFADFVSELDTLTISGVLDSPAAKVIRPALEPSVSPLLHWGLAIPTAAAVSIILSLFLTAITAGLISRSRYLDHSPAAGRSTLLTDPHWPMPQQASLPLRTRVPSIMALQPQADLGGHRVW